jgi:hypothetical protein
MSEPLHERILVHISQLDYSIFVVEKETDRVLIEIPVHEMPDNIYQCYRAQDEHGLAILVADTYATFLPIILTQTTLH